VREWQFLRACCAVDSCSFNRPGVGVVCGWLAGPSGQCHHPQYREVWRILTEEAQALAAESAPALEPAPVIPARVAEMHDLPARPSSKMQAVPARPARSLAGRAAAADAPMSAERARQLIMELEGV